MRSLALAAVLASLAGGAVAQEAMGTAGASGSPPGAETAQQIEDWIAASPVMPEEDVLQGLARPRDGAIHGQIELGVGTGGYRSAYITSVMPLGDNGTLALSFGQEKNARGYYRGAYGYPFGESLGYGLPSYYSPGRGPVW